MTEIWKPIPGHEPYEASDLGNIRNGMKGNVLVPVRWGNRGHVAVRTGGGRGARRHYVHRLVLMAFDRLPEEGEIGCHKNDINTQNNIENLYWGTYKENTQDAIRNGKFSPLPKQELGEKNQNAKYPDALIDELRNQYSGRRGEVTMLSKKYNMPIVTVYCIVKNLTRVAA